MSWKTTLSWEDAKKKAYILNQIRQFFYDLDVIEVETPLLGRSTVTDVHLEAFNTHFNYLPDSSINNADTLYLQTSPEFCMKRLLASGYQSIYQISKAFRHEAKGHIHNPEFTILEWYRIGFQQDDLILEVSDLIQAILKCDMPKVITYQNLFLEHLNIDALDTSVEELKDVISNHNKMSDWLKDESSIDTLLQFILSELIEPNIGIDTPIFIRDFPINQASLAKMNMSDERVADRFECYFKGIELVNGFCELTDAIVQVERFNKDNLERKQLGLEEKVIDRRFIQALESGLPSCSGVALGIDRLLMLALNKQDIEEVITFTIDRA
ncbi:elongation factor P--(R)-beta-lysine ligase [Pseudocolwellia sp. HL-MZ19]|uniref:elongation factor P--(R)-beta-lysine ligase n=1 Tax=Pseudocolwellia sp. HL-MZ19 TaxID=3400846 RepID=UPI003CE89532